MRRFIQGVLIAAVASAGVSTAALADTGSFTNFNQPAKSQYCKTQGNRKCHGNPPSTTTPAAAIAPATGAGVAPATGAQEPAAPGAGEAPAGAGQAPAAAGTVLRHHGGRSLPFTGFDLLLVVLIGIALVTVGTLLRAGGRLARRSNRAGSRA